MLRAFLGLLVGLGLPVQFLAVVLVAYPKPPQPDLHVLLIDLDADGLSPKGLCDERRGECTGEGVEHDVAGVGTGEDDAFQQGGGLLRWMLFVLFHAVAHAWDVPYVARDFLRVVLRGHRFAVVDQFALGSGASLHQDRIGIEGVVVLVLYAEEDRLVQRAIVPLGLHARTVVRPDDAREDVRLGAHVQVEVRHVLRGRHQVEAAVVLQLREAQVDPTSAPFHVGLVARPSVHAAVEVLADVVGRIGEDQVHGLIGDELFQGGDGITVDDGVAIVFDYLGRGCWLAHRWGKDHTMTYSVSIGVVTK